MENQKQIIIPRVVLLRDNYLLWSRITKTGLRCWGLWEHTEGTQANSKGKEKAGEETSQDESKWTQDNPLVLAVLQSSLEHVILAAYSYNETLKECWAPYLVL